MANSSSEEEEFTGHVEDDDDDDKEEAHEEEEDTKPAAVDDSPGRRSSRGSGSRVSYAENGDDGGDDDDDDSDDDDIPLAALVKKKPATPAKRKSTNGALKKKSPKKKPKPTTAPSTSSSSKKKYDFPSAALYQTESSKGLLIQRILCRWWYAYEWPSAAAVSQPPPHYDTLDGFPGVFVCTSPDGPEDVGHLLDVRDKKESPSFKVLSQKSSEELQSVLIRALQQQMQVLIAHEGKGTTTEKELQNLLKWAQKVNPAKAEKEAAKILKSQGFSST